MNIERNTIMTQAEQLLMKEDIIREYVQHHIDSFEDWDLFEENGNPVIVKEYEDSVMYEDYDEAFDDLFPEIRDSVLHNPLFDGRGNYIGYLSVEQLQFMGLEQEYERKKEYFIGDITFEKLQEYREEVFDGDGMAYIRNQERIDFTELARQIEDQIDIVDIVSETGLTVIPHATNYLKTQEHDSLIITKSKNRFDWYSQPPREADVKRAHERRAAGDDVRVPNHLSGGVITFYSHMNNKSFPETVKELIKRIDPDLDISTPKKDVQTKVLTPQERHRSIVKQMSDLNYNGKDLRAVMAYLTKTRMIDADVIKMMLKQNLIYQTHDDKGTYVTFVGRNEHGMISSAFRRSTYQDSSFKCDYKDCDYSRGWFFDPQMAVPVDWYNTPNHQMFDSRKTLLVFESNIEVLSYMTILKMQGKNPNNFAYLSCGSITKTACVEETLKLYGYKNVCICFNDDVKKDLDKSQGDSFNPGRAAAERLKDSLDEKGYNTRVLFPKDCNDWNDRLKSLKVEALQKKRNKAIGYERA